MTTDDWETLTGNIQESVDLGGDAEDITKTVRIWLGEVVAEWVGGYQQGANDEATRFDLPLHRTEAGYPSCSTCDGGGCPDCTDPA